MNDDEFLNTVYCFGNLSIDVDVMNSLNKIIYNPFVSDRKRAILNNLDIDPDVNYFNTEVVNNCTYFLTDEFNETVNTHWRLNTGKVFAHAYKL